MTAPAEHRWSGWPGAWCLDCGIGDQTEACLAEGCEGVLLCVEGHPQCDEHPYKGCAMHKNGPCPTPGAGHADPYRTRQQKTGFKENIT